MCDLKTSLVYLFLLFAVSGLAQKVSYGLGVGAHYGIFNFEETEQLSDAGFTTKATISPAVSFILDYKATSSFSVRLHPVLTLKQIRFTEVIDGVNSGDSNYLGINFIALDLGISGRFALPLKKWQLTPFAGLNFSFNKHTDSVFSARVNGGTNLIITQISQGNSFGPNELFIRPGLVAGIGIGKLNSKLELEAKLVYTPLNFVKSDIRIPFSDSVNPSLTGMFQYVGLGLNYKFN